MTEPKFEPGQRAYEAWCGSHGRDPAWRLLHPLDQMAWKAAEQTCAVTAPAVVTPEPTGGGKDEGRVGTNSLDWVRPMIEGGCRVFIVLNDGGATHPTFVGMSEDGAKQCAVRHGDYVVPFIPESAAADLSAAVLLLKEANEKALGIILELETRLENAATDAGKAQAESTWSALARWCATDAKEKRIGMNEYADGRWKVWAEWNDDAVTVGSGASADAASADLVACLNKMGGAYVIPPPPSAPEGT